MSTKFVMIQAIGFLGTIIFFLSYQCKSNKNLFRVQFISYSLYTIHLLMLGAITGGFSYILNTVRSLCLGSKNDFFKGKIMCVIICALQMITLYFTWNGVISILPIIANIATTIGGYTYNGKTIRMVGMLINSPLWIIYNILVGSWAGIMDEIVSEISMIISIVRYGWDNLNEVENL